MAIRLEDVRVDYGRRGRGGRPALEIARFEVPDGEQVCVTGNSGSGKTTLLHCIAGIVMPSRGAVLHGDVDIAGLREHDRDRFRAERVGYVFQTFNLLRGLTCQENVALAATLAGVAPREARERAAALLERVGLGEHESVCSRELSVGEQQRVAIARALVNRPGVVLADEPTANLDDATSDQVLELLADAARESGATLILVTHESRVRARFESVVPVAELAP